MKTLERISGLRGNEGILDEVRSFLRKKKILYIFFKNALSLFKIEGECVVFDDRLKIKSAGNVEWNFYTTRKAIVYDGVCKIYTNYIIISREDGNTKHKWKFNRDQNLGYLGRISEETISSINATKLDAKERDKKYVLINKQDETKISYGEFLSDQWIIEANEFRLSMHFSPARMERVAKFPMSRELQTAKEEMLSNIKKMVDNNSSIDCIAISIAKFLKEKTIIPRPLAIDFVVFKTGEEISINYNSIGQVYFTTDKNSHIEYYNKGHWLWMWDIPGEEEISVLVKYRKGKRIIKINGENKEDEEDIPLIAREQLCKDYKSLNQKVLTITKVLGKA